MDQDSQETDDIQLSDERQRKRNKNYTVHFKLQAIKAAKETSIRAASKRFNGDRKRV